MASPRRSATPRPASRDHSGSCAPVTSNEGLWQRRSGLVEAEVDGELIGLHVENGTCYGFNATATRIWALLEQPLTASELRDRLAAEFLVEREECGEAVLDLLDELRVEGLVEMVAPHGGVPPQ